MNFDPKSAQRIAKVVRDYERKAGQGTPRPSATVAPTRRFWVQLTTESPNYPGNYNWIKQDFVEGSFQDSVPTIQDNQNYSAQEANLAGGLENQFVELEFAGYYSDGTPVYLFNSRQIEFWGRIDCYCPLAANRWKYSFVEQILVSGDRWVDKPDGLYGDCCDTSGQIGYALNSVEANNIPAGVQGNSIDDTQSAPDGGKQYMLPVQGSPVVRMRAEYPATQTTASTGSSSGTPPPTFTFSYENAERDTAYGPPPQANTCCGSNSSTSSSSSSGLHCLFAFSCAFNCMTQTWGTVQKSGVNCQTLPPTLNAWVPGTLQTNNPVFYFFIPGPACPGQEKTAGVWPVANRTGDPNIYPIMPQQQQ